MITHEYTRLIGYYYNNEPNKVVSEKMDAVEYKPEVYEHRIYLYQVPKCVDRWKFAALYQEGEDLTALELQLDIPENAKLIGFDELEIGIVLELEKLTFVQKPKNKRKLKVI